MDIYVDLQGLSQVHRTLTSIRYDLADFDSSYASAHAPAMGHHRVIEAFESFVYGWTDGREKIDAQLEVAAQQIEGAVEVYTTTEQNLGQAADQMRDGMT